MGIFFILYNKGCDSMKAYEIKNAMLDTLDIFLTKMRWTKRTIMM